MSSKSLDHTITDIFINNEFVKTESNIDLINPVTEEEWLKVSAATPEDIKLAFQLSKDAEQKWKNTDARERGKLLYKLADLVEQHSEYLANLESKNTGIAICETKGFHIPFTINCLRYFAGWADKIGGKNIPFNGDFLCVTDREPIGTISSILPWNFPLMLLSWKMGPSLASGNCLVIKPSPYSPLTSLFMGKLVKEAGFPPNVFQVLPCLDDNASLFVSDPNIDKVSFTGSVATAKKISQVAAENLTEVGLELGGKSPVIICPDTKDSLDDIVNWAHMAIFLNHGQNCCAGSRIYVHESLYDEFVEKSVVLAKNRKVGDPFDKDVKQGPIINETQFNKIMEYIEKGKREGATLVCGGNRVGSKGYFLEPTIFTDTDETMTIVKEEIFGPVMCVLKYSTLDEVVERANNSNYGLAAGIFTNSLQNSIKISKEVKAGTVWINCYNWTDPASPFGGFKNSGNTRDLSKYAFENYTKVKSTIINYGPLSVL